MPLDLVWVFQAIWAWAVAGSAALNHVPLMLVFFVITWFAASGIAGLGRYIATAGSERLALYLIDPLTKWQVFIFAITLYMMAVAWPQGRTITDLMVSLRIITDTPMDDIVLWSAGLLLVWIGIAIGFYALAKSLGAKRTRQGLILQPKTFAEKAAFLLVLCPTAGILEEIVFRGFLLILFTQWAGGDIWSAALTTSILFGLGHAYQGAGGILATGIFGYTAAVSVIYSGSLVPAIIAHTLYDMATVVIYRPISEPPPGIDDFDLRRAERPFGWMTGRGF